MTIEIEEDVYGVMRQRHRMLGMPFAEQIRRALREWVGGSVGSVSEDGVVTAVSMVGSGAGEVVRGSDVSGGKFGGVGKEERRGLPVQWEYIETDEGPDMGDGPVYDPTFGDEQVVTRPKTRKGLAARVRDGGKK